MVAEAGVTQKPVELQSPPEFIRAINDDYKSKIAHVFILHGNINDFCENSGQRHLISRTMAYWYDSAVQRDLALQLANQKGEQRGLKTVAEAVSTKQSQKVLAFYQMGLGLEFAHANSRQTWENFMTEHYSGERALDAVRQDWKNPASVEGMLWVLDKWFTASKELAEENEQARKAQNPTRNELLFTIVFMDADAIFPNGEIAQMAMDRQPIVNLRAWARDEKIGDRSRIILLCNALTQIHESLRGGANGVAAHMIKKPTLEDREQWITNFDGAIRARTKIAPATIGQNTITQVNYAEGFDCHQFSIQSAGMNRRQIEDVIMTSWLNNEPIDISQVRARKQRALEDEYHGLVDFFEPDYGFEQIGGLDHVKEYMRDQIIDPLRVGDKRRCTKGVLLTGPPGTGKTHISKALAHEAKMNFLVARLDKLFGGLVGQTEAQTRKFFDAVESSAPCIVFMDEIDSALSSGRTSTGDSGTAARVFNSVMTFLSDEGRAGRVVVVAASNRPDLLDTALIRSGRFDAKIPALPPAKDDWKGRKLILNALCLKHQIKIHKDMQETEADPQRGLGLLLQDSERMWTGAEIEVVLKESLRYSLRASHKRIEIEDWERAFKYIIPNTEEVERMTYLALLYVDHLGYVGEAWRELAADKKGLRKKLKEEYKWDEDDD